jgi:hypothetical protein
MSSLPLTTSTVAARSTRKQPTGTSTSGFYERVCRLATECCAITATWHWGSTDIARTQAQSVQQSEPQCPSGGSRASRPCSQRPWLPPEGASKRSTHPHQLKPSSHRLEHHPRQRLRLRLARYAGEDRNGADGGCLRSMAASVGGRTYRPWTFVRSAPSNLVPSSFALVRFAPRKSAPAKFAPIRIAP